MLATMILFILINISCISATNNNATAEIITQDIDTNTEKILTDKEIEESEFSTLNRKIANSITSTINLTKNYTYNAKNDSNYTNGIIINKDDFTIYAENLHQVPI